MKRANKARPARHCCPIPSLRQVASMLAMGAGGTAFPQAALAGPDASVPLEFREPSVSDKATAYALEAEARQRKLDSDFKTAKEYLLEAYRLVRRPQLLVDAADCARAEGDWSLAGDLAQRVLREHESELTAGESARLEALASEADAHVARVTIRDTVSGDRVMVDGVAVGSTPLPGPIRISPGKHVLQFERTGYPPDAQKVEARAGEATEMAVPDIWPVAWGPGIPPPPPPPPRLPPKAGACGCGGGGGSQRPSQLASVALLAAALARRKRGSGNDR